MLIRGHLTVSDSEIERRLNELSDMAVRDIRFARARALARQRSERRKAERDRAEALEIRREGNLRLVASLRDRKASLDAMRNPEACAHCGAIFDAAMPFDWYCAACEGKRR